MSAPGWNAADPRIVTLRRERDAARQDADRIREALCEIKRRGVKFDARGTHSREVYEIARAALADSAAAATVDFAAAVDADSTDAPQGCRSQPACPPGTCSAAEALYAILRLPPGVEDAQKIAAETIRRRECCLGKPSDMCAGYQCGQGSSCAVLADSAAEPPEMT